MPLPMKLKLCIALQPAGNIGAAQETSWVKAVGDVLNAGGSVYAQFFFPPLFYLQQTQGTGQELKQRPEEWLTLLTTFNPFAFLK